MRATTRTLVLGLGAVLATAVVLAATGQDRVDEAASIPTTAPPTTGAPTTTAPLTTPPPTSGSPTTLPPTTGATESIAALVAAMGPTELAYQLVATGFNGNDAATQLTEIVGSSCVGGVFVTESNENWVPIDDHAAAVGTITTIRDTAADCAIRPFVATDAELGDTVRVPVESRASTTDWATRYATNQYDTLAALYDEVADYAAELLELGIDVNLGTVADVATGSEHYMAREGRTFGADDGVVTALTTTMVGAQCDAGLAPALKHFPNQGATLEDPHDEPSVAVGGVESLTAEGRRPYVDTSAPIVMVGHILEDPSDPLPASMSVAAIGRLRDDYPTGVVITDDMSTMRGAIEFVRDPGERAVRAIVARADLVLFVDDADIPPAIDALVARMAEGDDFEELARDAAGRTLRLKAALGLIPAIDGESLPLCG